MHNFNIVTSGLPHPEYRNIEIMETTLSLFNQINSLSYWFLHQSRFKCVIKLDAEIDEYYVSVRKNNETLYSYSINRFSKKNRSYLEFELRSIVNQLLYFKDYVAEAS